MYCNYEQNDWANLLDTAAFVYNNTVHNSIGVSPFFACYGWNPKAHPDIPQRLGVNDPGRFEYLMDGKERCKYLQEQIREAQRRSVNQYNRKHKDIEFKVGDMVYINRRNWKTRRPTPKLDTRFAGPYPVQERVGRRAYRITLPANLRVHDVFHVSMLEPARTSSLPQRAEQPTMPPLPDEDLDLKSKHSSTSCHGPGCSRSRRVTGSYGRSTGIEDLVDTSREHGRSAVSMKTMDSYGFTCKGALSPYARRTRHSHEEDQAQRAGAAMRRTKLRWLPLRGSRDRNSVEGVDTGHEEEEQCRRSRHRS
ncbi:hypothetical protein NDA15_004049 [Ustilago hordei]|nr:hypothetical protein NDA15_004049 [Ustilago hordei]